MPKLQALEMIGKLYRGQGQREMLFIHFRNKAGTFSGEGNKGARSVIQERKGRTWSASWWEEVSVEEKETLLSRPAAMDHRGSRRWMSWGSSGAMGRFLQGRESEELGRKAARTPGWTVAWRGAPGLYILQLILHYMFQYPETKCNQIFNTTMQQLMILEDVDGKKPL